MQTALDSTEDKVEGLEAGADDYITKPIDFAELKARLRSMLRIKRLQEALEEREKELLEVNERLRYMSQTDALTGLDNRRHLNERIEEMFAHAQAARTSRSRCVMCDLDKFKSVNDTYGHQAGDEVLKQLAAILKEEAREIDRVGRYGGEEFMLLLPGHGARRRRRPSPRGCANASRAIHSPSPEGPSRARPASAWRDGRIRGSTSSETSCAPRTTRSTSRRRRGATGSSASTATSSTRTRPQHDGADAAPRTRRRRTRVRRSRRPAVTSSRASAARVAELQRERDHLARHRRHPPGSLRLAPLRRRPPGHRPQARRDLRARSLRDLPLRRQGRGPPRRQLRGSDDPQPRRRPQPLPGAEARLRERRDGVHPRRRERPDAAQHQVRSSTCATSAPSSWCRSAGRAPSSARSSCAPSARPSRSARPTSASARRWRR